MCWTSIIHLIRTDIFSFRFVILFVLVYTRSKHVSWGRGSPFLSPLDCLEHSIFLLFIRSNLMFPPPLSLNNNSVNKPIAFPPMHSTTSSAFMYLSPSLFPVPNIIIYICSVLHCLKMTIFLTLHSLSQFTFSVSITILLRSVRNCYFLSSSDPFYAVSDAISLSYLQVQGLILTLRGEGREQVLHILWASQLSFLQKPLCPHPPLEPQSDMPLSLFSWINWSST